MGSQLLDSEKASRTSPAKKIEEVVSSTLPKFVVVILHGLTMYSDECDEIKSKVLERFGEDVIVIQPKCREGYKSVFISMDKQAELVVREVIKNLTDRCPRHLNKELRSLPMFFVGHSQGGMLSMIMADTYTSDLNIMGIVSINSPLTGTQPLENNRHDMKVFQKRSKAGLKAIGHPDINLIDVNALLIVLNNPLLKAFSQRFLRGAKDMYSSSDIVSRIKRFVRGYKHTVPILLIATYIENLAEYFDYGPEDEDKVNEFLRGYTKLITRDDYGEHDFLIATKSQLCRTDSFADLAQSKDDPVYPSNVKIRVFRNLLHAYNMIPFLSSYRVKRGELCVKSNKVISIILDFIEEHIRILQ